MKVVHVVPYFPPDRLGGVGEVAAHLHRALLERGHDSIVVTSGVSVDDARVRRVGATPTRFVLASWRAWREIRSADVVHAHHGEGLLLLLAARLGRRRPRIVVTFHTHNLRLAAARAPLWAGRRGMGEGLARRAGVWARAVAKAALDRAAKALADETTYVSRSVAADHVGDASAADANVIHNGVPPTKDYPDPASPVELLYVGTGGAHKRVTTLPLVLSAVRSAHPRARLRIVGVAHDSIPGLADLIAELGLEDAVEFVGPVPSASVPRFYRAADVLVVPSAYEGLPMVILEAFDQRLPCVATSVGGIPEVVDDGATGFLVPPDHPEVMAERSCRLLADPELRRSMGEAAARRVGEDFRIDRHTERYAEIYGRLAGVAR